MNSDKEPKTEYKILTKKEIEDFFKKLRKDMARLRKLKKLPYS